MNLHVVIPVLLLAWTSSAYSQTVESSLEFKHEILTRLTGSDITMDTDGAIFAGVGVGYGHFFSSTIEGIADVSFGFRDSQSGSGSYSLVVAVGPRFNFSAGQDTSPANAFFVGILGGVVFRDTANRSATARYLAVAEVGKRFRLGSGGVSFSPSFEVRKFQNRAVEFALIPISFSLLL